MEEIGKTSIPLALPCLCISHAFYLGYEEIAWKYRPYAWFWCMEHRNGKEYKQEQKELAVIIDNACSIHCTKQSHVLRYLSYWLRSELCRWGPLREGSIVESQLSQSLLCHSHLSYFLQGLCMYVFSNWHPVEKAWTTRLFTSGQYCIAAHIHEHRIALFSSQFPYSIHCWHAYCLPFNAILANSSPQLSNERNVDFANVSIHRMAWNVPPDMTTRWHSIRLFNVLNRCASPAYSKSRIA